MTLLLQASLSIMTFNLHWYNKTSRPGRKLGHLNILADDEEQLGKVFEQIESQLSTM